MKKITEEELKEVNELRSKLSTTVNETGELTLGLNLLEDDVNNIKRNLTEKVEEFKALLAQEKTIIIRLREQYGVGSIDFETGEFTPES